MLRHIFENCVFLFIVYFIIIIFTGYVYNANAIQYFANNCVNNAIGVQLLNNNNIGASDIKKMLLEDYMTTFRVPILTTEGVNIYGYGSNEYNYVIINDFIIGRFFNTKDYINSEKVAVVGKDVLNNSIVISINNDNYIKYKEDLFHIVGILIGDNQYSICNNIALINITALNEKYNNIVIGNSNIEKLLNKYYSNIDFKLYNVDNYTSNIVSFLSGDVERYSICTMILVAIVCTAVYCKIAARDLYAYKVIGISCNDYVKQKYKDECIASGISIGIIISIYELFRLFKIDILLNTATIMIISLLLCIIIGLFLAMILMMSSYYIYNKRK